MTDSDRELMERYIYEVVSKLPKNQREEITLELRELIGDMAEEKTMDEALSELGDPRVFARKYKGDHRYLIGPEYYDNYITILKIVLPILAGLSVAAGVVQMIIGSGNGIDTSNGVGDAVTGIVNTTTDIFGITTGSILESLIGAFGVITFIFAVMERNNVKMNTAKKKGTTGWTPGSLQPIPSHKAVIKKADCIVSMAFNLIFGVLLVFAPRVFSAYYFQDGKLVKMIPIFNVEYWNITAVLFAIVFILGFMDEVVKLIKGCYCKIVLASGIISGIINLAITAVIFKALPLFNSKFFEQSADVFGVDKKNELDVLNKLDSAHANNILFALFAVIICAEMGITIYKSVIYGRDMNNR